MRHTVLAPSRQSPPHDPNPRQCPCLPQDRHRTQDCQRIDHVKCHVNRENESKWKSTSRCSLSASLSALFSAMAFGRPCRVIAARMHAEKEDFEDYEFQKSGGHRERQPLVFRSPAWGIRGRVLTTSTAQRGRLQQGSGARCVLRDFFQMPSARIASRPCRSHVARSCGARSRQCY